MSFSPLTPLSPSSRLIFHPSSSLPYTCLFFPLFLFSRSSLLLFSLSSPVLSPPPERWRRRRRERDKREGGSERESEREREREREEKGNGGIGEGRAAKN
jgi:hypothetical protein